MTAHIVHFKILCVPINFGDIISTLRSMNIIVMVYIHVCLQLLLLLQQ